MGFGPGGCGFDDGRWQQGKVGVDARWASAEGAATEHAEARIEPPVMQSHARAKRHFQARDA